jgi:hypothetical protein
MSLALFKVKIAEELWNGCYLDYGVAVLSKHLSVNWTNPCPWVYAILSECMEC